MNPLVKLHAFAFALFLLTLGFYTLRMDMPVCLTDGDSGDGRGLPGEKERAP